MNLRKRTLALLLTLCLMFSVMVPLVSAEVTIPTAVKIQMGSNADKGYDKNWAYIAQSDGITEDISTWCTVSYLQMVFKSAHANNGDWVAVRINSPVSGTYHLNMVSSKNVNGAGVSDVYFLNDTTKTGADLKAYITDNMTDENLLGRYDSAETTIPAGMGTVNIQGNSFILVFKPIADQEKFRAGLAWVKLTNVLECADATTLTETLAAAAEHKENTLSRTIKLTADFTAGDVVIPENFTLDLNGHTLTVNSINSEVKQIGEGSIKVIDPADKTAADAVQAQIDAIGTVTLESEAAIKAARTAYDALTDAQKALVNIDALTAAEAKLAELKTPAPTTPATSDPATNPASPIVYIVIAVVALAVVAAVAIILIRKKKN